MARPRARASSSPARDAPPAGQRRSAGGFTLIEILVAFAIMAIALGALLQAFSGGLRSVAVAEAHVIAAMQARSKMAEVAHVIPLQPGEYSGTFENESRWTVTINPVDPSDFGDATFVTLAPYEVHVTVSWDDNRQVSISSMRLGLP